MPDPLVSIVIPVFNRADLLGETLDSLLAQTNPRWEAVAVDDGSTDDSFAVLEDYARRDPRIRPLHRTSPTKGAPACRNEGVANSKGAYIVFLDSDDLLAEHAVAQRIAELGKDDAQTFDLLVTQTRLFEAKPGDRQTYWNAYTDRPDVERFLGGDAVWGTAASTWRRSFITELGGFDEAATVWQDWELHCRALMAGAKYRKLEEADVWYRQARDQSQFRQGYRTPRYWLRVAATARGVLDGAAKAQEKSSWVQLLTATYLKQLWNASARGKLLAAWKPWRSLRARGVISGVVYRRGVLLLWCVRLGRGQGFALRKMAKVLPPIAHIGKGGYRETATQPTMDGPSPATPNPQ